MDWDHGCECYSSSIVCSQKSYRTPGSSRCTSPCLSPSRTLQHGRFSGGKVRGTTSDIFPSQHFHRWGTPPLSRHTFPIASSGGPELEPEPVRLVYVVLCACSVCVEDFVPVLLTLPPPCLWGWNPLRSSCSICLKKKPGRGGHAFL